MISASEKEREWGLDPSPKPDTMDAKICGCTSCFDRFFRLGFILADQRCHQSRKQKAENRKRKAESRKQRACINDRTWKYQSFNLLMTFSTQVSWIERGKGKGEVAAKLGEPPLKKHPTIAQIAQKPLLTLFDPKSDGRILIIGWRIGTNSQGQDRILTSAYQASILSCRLYTVL